MSHRTSLMTLALAAALTAACGARPPPAASPNGSPAAPGGAGAVVTTALAAPATNLASFSFAQSPDPGLINSPLTVMATLAGVTPAGTPTGTVTFTEFVSGIVLCAGVPVSGGVATCVFTPTNTWPYVEAAYSGDATYPALTDYFSPVVLGPQAVFQSLSASPSPTPSGASFTVSGTLVAQPPATGTVTGDVDLFVDDVWYGYVSTTTGSFSFTVSGIADGEHQVAVAFSDPLFYWDLTSDSFTHWVGTGTPIPSSITVISGGGQSAAVGKAFASPICVQVLDQDQLPLSGQTVSFTAPASGASASVPSAITGLDGAACSTPTANATGGTYTVTASAGSVVTAPGASLTNLKLTSIVASSGTTQSTVVGLPFTTPVCARALDQNGAPMAGQLLAFAAPATTASAVLSASAPTNASGVACTSAAANTVTGSYAITASSAGVSGSVATLTNTAGAAHHVGYVTTGSNVQSATVATAFALTLGVKVFDVYNNPVPGVTIGWRLRAPAALAKATLDTASAVSNASGQAEARATANTVTGSYFVDVTVTGLTIDPAAFAFALTNTAGAPASIAAAASSTPQTATVGGLAFANPLAVTVKDLYANVVPGSSVTFTAPGSGRDSLGRHAGDRRRRPGPGHRHHRHRGRPGRGDGLRGRLLDHLLAHQRRRRSVQPPCHGWTGAARHGRHRLRPGPGRDAGGQLREPGPERHSDLDRAQHGRLGPALGHRTPHRRRRQGQGERHRQDHRGRLPGHRLGSRWGRPEAVQPHQRSRPSGHRHGRAAGGTPGRPPARGHRGGCTWQLGPGRQRDLDGSKLRRQRRSLCHRSLDQHGRHRLGLGHGRHGGRQLRGECQRGRCRGPGGLLPGEPARRPRLGRRRVGEPAAGRGGPTLRRPVRGGRPRPPRQRHPAGGRRLHRAGHRCAGHALVAGGADRRRRTRVRHRHREHDRRSLPGDRLGRRSGRTGSVRAREPSGRAGFRCRRTGVVGAVHAGGGAVRRGALCHRLRPVRQPGARNRGRVRVPGDRRHLHADGVQRPHQPAGPGRGLGHGRDRAGRAERHRRRSSPASERHWWWSSRTPSRMPFQG
jgi:hypothetical protein